MPNFMLPGLYENFKLNTSFLKVLQLHPEYFIDDLHISAVYGNFQYCLWDGGRIFTEYKQATLEDIETIIAAYNEDFNVPMRFVFTSSEVKPTHYKDRFCNLVLSVCENDKNEVVVNNDGLCNYIKEHYPKYKHISSTTKCLTSSELLKTELAKEEFSLVCLDYNLNHNMSFLSELSPEEKTKCEFLVNAICASGCPNRKEHYRLNSLFYLNYGKPYSMSYCPIEKNTLYPNHLVNRANNISPEEILNTYVPQGFVNFKLEGRSLSPLENACNYVKYMVKPEYQLYVLNLLDL